MAPLLAAIAKVGLKAIEEAGYLAGSDVLIGLDCAASEFYKDGKYRFESEHLSYTSQQFTDLLETWCDKYPIVSVEDGMAEGDWEGWETLTQRLGKRVQLVGDDVFVTNPDILADGRHLPFEDGSVDALLIGRRTWEVVSRFPAWPYGEKPVFVLTRRPAEGRHGERFLQGSPAEVLAALGDAGARRVYVDGGRVVSRVLAAGLLDELTISILPVVLGRGIPLFVDAGPERWLDLASSRAFGGGMVQLRYAARPRPPPATSRPSS